MSKKVLLGSLPSSDKLKYKSVTTSIFEMSKKDATYWDKEVQPLINIESKYTVRADACWKWVSFYSSLSRAVRLSKSPSSCFVLKSKSEINKKWYPISMLMVRKPCPALHNNENNSSYLWFLSTAPRSYLSLYYDEHPKLVGTASIIAMILDSFQEGYKGRIGLHAAKKGGADLIDFYKNRVGLLALPIGIKVNILLSFFLGGNDGRYFYSDRGVAKNIVLGFVPFLESR